MAEQRKVTATDFSLFGETDSNGNLIPLTTDSSIENAFRQWMLSQRGENPRAPDRGGYVIRWLMKPLSEENADDMRSAILDGLEQDFFPYLIVESLSVTPLYTERRWQIALTAYSPQYKTKVESTTNLRSIG